MGSGTRPATLALVGLVAATAGEWVAPSGAAGPGDPLVPTGQVVLLEDAAWSWFEDERVVFDADGSSLLLSAVTGEGSADAAPGTVALVQLDLISGSRSQVDLGRAEVDDHNSASIHEGPTGELTTAWTRHHADSLIRTQRRRTDGSWLRLPAVDLGSPTTYSNLRSSADATGATILYDFLRGERFDPEVVASSDEGRTWNRLGRLLRDPADGPSVRPYVQYSADVDGRIDLIATESHPRQAQTAIFHGFIRSGLVHDSTGTVLGPIGSAIPVTSLTPVWTPPADERAWTTDIVMDPVEGRPVVLFSVRHTVDDHRYWYARWDGSAWLAEEIAPAGGALYAAEEDYAGLAALDPADVGHVVTSTPVSPSTGQPLVSAADGRVHWELWDGRRDDDGTWAWAPLTAESTVDNLRPVLAAGPGSASALAWLRGTYRTYRDYEVDVVGVVHRPDGGLVPPGSASWEPAVDVIPDPPLGVPAAVPLVGAFDGHPAADILLVRAGTAPEALLLGDDQRHPTPIAAPTVNGTYEPLTGDFDGDGRDDILWYAPGTATDHLWRGGGVGQLSSAPVGQVLGTYRAVAGDFDGDGRDDVLWHAPGSVTDHLWRGTTTGFLDVDVPQPDGTLTPIVGRFDGDGRDDVYWYAPGPATDHLWMGTATGFRSAPAQQVQGSYTPVPGDYDGDGRDDIFWYAPGSATDHLWMRTTTDFADAPARQVSGTYIPIGADLDGDGRSDIHWYRPGVGTDHLWWSADGPLASTEAGAANL